ncbi:uncharacterized protein BDV14DRAFT_178583 [Aspergillus stella-maris]|uniref:uncharacterized protein n=1 Tax=Aspergillus stella-maris TaxID=1810926 RepID=UPI003CCE14E4
MPTYQLRTIVLINLVPKAAPPNFLMPSSVLTHRKQPSPREQTPETPSGSQVGYCR